MSRIGGTVQLTRNGEVLSVKGSFSHRGNQTKKTMIAGNNSIPGHSETVLVPYIEGVITFTPNLNIEDLRSGKDDTISLLLPNDITFQLSHAVFAGEDAATTEEGEIPVRWEGTSGEYV